MKKYTLLGHVFELEDNAYHFLSRYIERIEQYSVKHEVAHDVIDDIKYSIIEKLYTYETPITESQVIAAANSIGEPEVMFDESDEQTTSDDVKKTNILNREKPVIRGVCYWLAKSLNVQVMIIRIIFLILLVGQGAGLLIYIILALFVPFKDKKKTTGVIGNVFFEIVRIVFRLIILSIILPLSIAAIAVTGAMFFAPVIDNQSIAARIPQYMYIVAILISIAFLIFSIGSIGSLLKQRRINTALGLFATIIIIVGGVITAGTVFKTVMLASNHQTAVEQNIAFSGSTISGDRVSVDMTTITDYSNKWPYFGVGSADVRIIRTSSTGTDIRVEVKTTLRGQSDAQLGDTASKLLPLTITGDANHVIISGTGKLFSSEVPLAGVHRHIVIAVPANVEVYINKDRRTNMYVQNDGLQRGYCAAKVYVYNPEINEFTCKNSSGEVFYDTDQDLEDMIEERIEHRIEQRMNEVREGFDAIPPMYPQEQRD